MYSNVSNSTPKNTKYTEYYLPSPDSYSIYQRLPRQFCYRDNPRQKSPPRLIVPKWRFLLYVLLGWRLIELLMKGKCQMLGHPGSNKDVKRSFPVFTSPGQSLEIFGKVTKLCTQIFVAQQNWLQTKKWQNLVLIQSANLELNRFL